LLSTLYGAGFLRHTNLLRAENVKNRLSKHVRQDCHPIRNLPELRIASGAGLLVCFGGLLIEFSADRISPSRLQAEAALSRLMKPRTSCAISSAAVSSAKFPPSTMRFGLGNVARRVVAGDSRFLRSAASLAA